MATKQQLEKDAGRHAGEELHRAVMLRVEDVDVKSRKVRVSFSSQTTEVRSWWSGYPEILLHEAGSVDFSRIQESGSVLFNHDRGYVLGRPEDFELDEKTRKCRATIVFDDDADADKIFRKVKNGSIRGASAGWRAQEWMLLDESQVWVSPGGQRFEGPAEIATKWAPFEFSITPVPADGSVGVNRSDAGHKEPAKRETNMAKAKTGEEPAEGATATAQQDGSAQRSATPAAPATAAATQAAPAAQSQTGQVLSLDEARARYEADGATRERERITGIRSAVAAFRSTKAVADLEEDLLKDPTMTVERAQAKILSALQDASAPVGTARRLEVGVDERDKWRDAATDWLFMRSGKLEDPVATRAQERTVAARQIKARTLLDLAQQCLDRCGAKYEWGNKVLIAERAISHSGSDFPLITENAINKVLLKAYDETPSTWQPLTVRGTATDFKKMKRYKLGAFGDLEPLTSGSPMAEGTLPEARAEYSIGTYAKRIGIHRQMIIDDDLGAFTSIPEQMGRAARRTVNKRFWAFVQGTDGLGPTMGEDGKKLFATDHPSGSNYLTGAAKPTSVTNVNAAKVLMRKQKLLADTNDTAPYGAGISPRWLVVPPDLETEARQFQASIVDPSKNNAVPNPFQGQYDIICEPVLELGTDGATAWYFVGDPTQWGGIEVAFLDGREQPNVIREENTKILGLEFGIYLDFGFGAIEHRSWFRHKGAA